MWQQLRFTVLFVTHSIEEAMLIGSRILVLTPHPGRVRAELDADGFGFDSLDRVEFGAMFLEPGLGARSLRAMRQHQPPEAAPV